MTYAPLKLRAHDFEDIEVVSTVLQDSIVPVGDMLFQPDDQSFVMVVDRFCWHGNGKARTEPPFERVHCAVTVNGVQAVQTQGLDLAKKSQLLDLLAVLTLGDQIDFVFAGNARIRLSLKKWCLLLEDFGEPWPTTCKPNHIS